MAQSAAFFDLDRTLVLGASGPVISAGLRRQGLLPARSLPGENFAFGLFNLLGENLPSILLSRQGARAAKGWSVDKVAKAAADVAEPLAELVEPFALAAIEEHRQLGRKLVLATTTPFDLIEPFAERLGFDDVLATRFRVTDGPDGQVYDGTIDGEFVWSTGKARSVAVWATANLIELADSYAYSDSIYDVPMLSSVGYPVAVNPDPRLAAYAAVRGWQQLWFNAPAGVPKPFGIEPQDVVARLANPRLLPWIDLDTDGLEHLPDDGGALLVANHTSRLDPLIVANATAKRGRSARFLVTGEIGDVPLIGSLAKLFGAISIGGAPKRGLAAGTSEATSGDSSHDAAQALRAGELVTLFSAADDEAAIVAAARLAIETGVPLVPVGILGAEKAWPQEAKLPYVMNLADRPTVGIRIGLPYLPIGHDPQIVADELVNRITKLVPNQVASRS